MDCDGCTLCCDLLPVPILNKKPYDKCVHCKLSKCLIHDHKPDFCESYDCMYAQVSDLPLELRPDKCWVIYEKINEEVIYGLQHPDRKPTKMAVKQAKDFIDQGFSVVIKKKNNRMQIFLAEGHNGKEVENIIINKTRSDGIRN